MSALRDLRPGDRIRHRGQTLTVAKVEPAFDDHGYPIVAVLFEEQVEPLVHNASYSVERV